MKSNNSSKQVSLDGNRGKPGVISFDIQGFFSQKITNSHKQIVQDIIEALTSNSRMIHSQRLTNKNHFVLLNFILNNFSQLQIGCYSLCESLSRSCVEDKIKIKIKHKTITLWFQMMVASGSHSYKLNASTHFTITWHLQSPWACLKHNLFPLQFHLYHFSFSFCE